MSRSFAVREHAVRAAATALVLVALAGAMTAVAQPAPVERASGEATPPARATPAADRELAAARAQALRALEEPAAAKDAWRACAEAGERAVRTVAPEWGSAVDRGDDAVGAAKSLGAAAAEPLYWTALCNMNLARQTGFSATLAANSLARGLMDRAAELDETVDHGGPARALGAWYAALPAGSGGGARQSRAWFDRARKIAPHYLLTRVEEARTYAVVVQDRALFERLLGEVLAFDLAKAPALRRENEIAKREAKGLRARADRLF